MMNEWAGRWVACVSGGPFARSTVIGAAVTKGKFTMHANMKHQVHATKLATLPAEPLWHVPHLVMCVRRTSRLTALCTADRTTHVPMTPLSLRTLKEQCELGSTDVRPNTKCLCLNLSDSLGNHMLTHLANMMRGGERDRARNTASLQLPK